MTTSTSKSMKKLTKAQVKAITTSVRSHLVLMVKAANADAAATAELKDRKVGTYGLAVQSAIACKSDVALFESIYDGFMKDIRENVDGIAKKNGCKASEKKKGQFVVPSAVSSAKSHLKRAMTFGVELIDDGKPRSFGSIRDDASAIQAQYDLDNADDETKQRIGLLATLDQLSERAAKLDGVELDSLATAVQSLYDALNVIETSDDDDSEGGVGDALANVEPITSQQAATA